jgi:hypothetical protein
MVHTSSGLLADFNDAESIKKTMITLFDKFLDQSIFDFQNEHIEKYSRKGLTEKIARLLDEMI